MEDFLENDQLLLHFFV